MLIRRTTLRAALALVAVALAVAGLSGCRTDPSVAAYVDDGQISVQQLKDQVAGRTDGDPALAGYAKANPAAFTRQVLGFLVDQRVYAAAADRYGVQVSDAQVRNQLDSLLAGTDADQQYAAAAAQGFGRGDLFQLVRQQLILLGIADAKGLSGPLSEQALRDRYEQEKADSAQIQFGYITVPDQATADAVLTQLTADPGSYPALAAQHAGNYTLPEMVTRTPDQVPQQLAQGIAAAKPNTGFTTPIAETGGIVVTFVGGPVYPSYADMHDQLQQEAQRQVLAAAQKYIDQVRDDLHVTINPRYGVLKNGQIQQPTGGVVDILGGSGPGSAAAGAGSGAAGSGAAGSGSAGSGATGNAGG